MNKVIDTDKAPKVIGPYSQAIISGDFIFTSGQIPVNPVSGSIEGADIEAQARQVLENIKAVLEAAGSSFKDVIKTTVFIKNISEFVKVNEIYAEYFTEPFPARSCIEAAGLPKDALIEIEVIAVNRNEK